MHPGEPLVSVVIPCKARVEELVRALDSVWGQSLQDFEVIVVDDGSDEPLAAALKRLMARRLAGGRLRVLRHENSRGAAAARNTGVAAARGRYVAFLDSDDSWVPEKLQRQTSFMLDARRQGSFTSTLVERDGVIEERRPGVRRDRDVSLAEFLWLKGGFIQTSGVMIAREVAGAFPDGMRLHQDLAWYLEREAAGIRFDHLDQPLVVWRDDRRPDRLTLAASARGFVRWAAEIPSDHWSARARAACLFHGAFWRALAARDFNLAWRVARETLPLLGPGFALSWFAGGVGRRLAMARRRASRAVL